MPMVEGIVRYNGSRAAAMSIGWHIVWHNNPGAVEIPMVEVLKSTMFVG
jgi:hypothetical protein